MLKYHVIITGEKLAIELKKVFIEHEIEFFELTNCKGFSAKLGFFEFLGMTEQKKRTLIFKTTESLIKSLIKFVHKYYNTKNNGIMFSIKGDGKMADMALLATIVNAGKGEKVVDIIRKKAIVGSTVVEGRGKGATEEEFFGVKIDSSKELVLSVMPESKIALVQKTLKTNFASDNTDVVTFVLPVCDFNKMHQDK